MHSDTQYVKFSINLSSLSSLKNDCIPSLFTTTGTTTRFSSHTSLFIILHIIIILVFCSFTMFWKMNASCFSDKQTVNPSLEPRERTMSAALIFNRHHPSCLVFGDQTSILNCPTDTVEISTRVKSLIYCSCHGLCFSLVVRHSGFESPASAGLLVIHIFGHLILANPLSRFILLFLFNYFSQTLSYVTSWSLLFCGLACVNSD